MSINTIRLVVTVVMSLAGMQCCAGLFVLSVSFGSVLADGVLVAAGLLAVVGLEQIERLRHRPRSAFFLFCATIAALWIGVGIKWRILTVVLPRAELVAYTTPFRIVLDMTDIAYAACIYVAVKATLSLNESAHFVKRADRPHRHRASPFDPL